MSIRGPIEAAVAKAQRGVRVAAEDRFIRGMTLVAVDQVSGDGVDWTDSVTGETHQGSLAEFRSRALRRLPSTLAVSGEPLDRAWDIAGARQMPPGERSAALRQFLGLGSAADDEVINGWISALARGEEPERQGTARDKEGGS